ncbi:CoA ester lyase [Streptomyces sp. APSN-46.1]|uniref:HpcH/HpaI aldolase/citrate lyase family protein n=1 Tax=Streptomyces sp. APSN-46.1 TaxID=2929049 RepID=UPI001FB24140|nr:CoA ester lyase [Streptomyces sp. APSN-46.1]MCJ1681186.1 CoA ester lyase [Streptomyces sp. APSN-46.1]
MILTWLYVPGDRPEVVAKALRSGADAVIVDLEDAVSASRKEYARTATAELLAERPPVPVHVRVNALGSPWAGADLTALATLHGLAGLRLPKISAPEQISHVAERTGGVALYVLLESALGVERAYEIARAHPALRGLSLGEADLRADLGVTAEAGLDWPRSRIVVAARAAGLAPPAQSVFPDIRDLEGLAVSCARGRSLGFLGRAAIHPRQLPVIERTYLPAPEEVTAAEEILSAARATPGALALPDGRFVDPAVVAAAHRTLALAARTATR